MRTFPCQSNFDAAAAVMDFQGFADYWATEIWSSNSSWGHNVVLSKPTDSGRWRFIFTDLDRGFSGSTNDDIGEFTTAQNNSYDYARNWIRHALENQITPPFSLNDLPIIYTPPFILNVSTVLSSILQTASKRRSRIMLDAGKERHHPMEMALKVWDFGKKRSRNFEHLQMSAPRICSKTWPTNSTLSLALICAPTTCPQVRGPFG